MALYEDNWRLLQVLAPRLASLRGAHDSRASGDCALRLAILESTRYTTTLRLTYLFEDDEGPVADPDFTLRVYRDARQVEALACIHSHRHEVLRRFSRETFELDRRWQRNVVLNKWLSYLLERGHLFTGFARSSALAEAR
jgi:uncharacterized protein